MAEEWLQMAGQIDSPLAIDDLAVALVGQGIRLQVRESCHYEGGRYIRVNEGMPEFTLERVHGEFLARADAVSIQQMREVTSRMSVKLAALDIRHRFELYGAASELVDYLHHRWPEERYSEPTAAPNRDGE